MFIHHEARFRRAPWPARGERRLISRGSMGNTRGNHAYNYALSATPMIRRAT